MFCTLRATSLGEASTEGGGGGATKITTFNPPPPPQDSPLFTPPRHQPEESLLEVFCVHTEPQSRHFQMIYSFSRRCV